ncbi:MAG: peptide chain release factor N(5)-glutamine methyltransferase [Candidatus Edwardsbacteria bacterium]
MTLISLLQAGIIFLQEKGIENARQESEILLAETLGLSPIDLYLNASRVISYQDRKNFLKWLKERAKHRPLQYILGYTEFMGLRLKVREGVFIPRPETEILVETVLKTQRGFRTILDIGTGSGAIAIALVKFLLEAKIYANDISKEAITLARKNAKETEIDGQIEFVEGNILIPERLKGKIDLIISNPPYIKRTEIPYLPPEVSDFEPWIALDGGEDGFSFYQRIAEQASIYLSPKGILSLEVDDKNASQVVEILNKNNK